MVTVIHDPSTRLQKVVNYNEKKVQQGVAKCLLAENYPMDAAEMNFHQKLARLKNQAALNTTTKENAIHITIGFDPGEKLTEDRLRAIARDYMQGIGFGEQPFLVYEHKDTGNSHIHIVTTCIQADGKRIDMFNLGRNQSEHTRKRLEEKYGLVKAEEKSVREFYQPRPLNPQVAEYGKAPAKTAIQNILLSTFSRYNYTSLHELNALLNQYNIKASTGSKDSRTYKHGGLLYQHISKGKPIKASKFYFKPTLKELSKRFAKGKVNREKHKQKLKYLIDQVLHSQKITSLELFTKALESKGVQVVARKTEHGLVYGLTYIDHNTRCVFNGSDLDKNKQYSAKAVTEKLNSKLPPAEELKLQMKSGISTPAKDNTKEPTDKKAEKQTTEYTQPARPEPVPSDDNTTDDKGLIELLTQPEQASDYLPWHLRNRKRRKKRRRPPTAD